MIVFVAGASGFLGGRLLKRLSRDGHEIFATTRSDIPQDLQNLPRVRWLKGDILKGEIEFKALPYFNAVVNLVGATLGAGKDELLFLRANELATIHVCQELAERFDIYIYASSQVVYGDACNLAVNEDFPLIPNGSAYACSKLNAENWLRWFQKRNGREYLTLRLCGFIEGGGIIDYIIDRASTGEVIELFGNGNVRRDYLPVEKAVDVMVSALNYKGGPGFLPVNIGSGQAISAQELALLICSELQSPSQIHLLDSPSPQGDFVFNIDLAKKLFDFCPGSLADAVRSYARQRWDEVRRGG